ncbi:MULTISPECIES: AMP-binding protein [unclassified Chryseobacterium]|uniref:AMP-binding protein n=1 Tax=unclassified Chryseobacterium TaxID=2593645 RepID=UPI00300FE1A3
MLTNNTIIDLFKEQAHKASERIAIIYDNKKISYQELEQVSSLFATFLFTKYRIGAKKNIILNLPKNDHLIIAILGVLKLNAVYIPVDSESPEGRLDLLNSICNSELMITESLMEEFFNEKNNYTGNASVFTSNDKKMDEDTACILFTSGTTGIPKGVKIKQSSIINLVYQCEYFPLSQETIMLSTGNVSFDATLFEFFGTLLNGGTLVVCDKGTLLDTPKLKKTISNHAVNSAWITSSLFSRLIDNDLSLFDDVKHIITGGSVVSPTHIDKLYKYNAQITIYNGYGPTESTTFACVYKIERRYYKNIPIGKPIKGIHIFILDNDGAPVTDKPGIIYISGAGISEGYINKVDDTDRFVKNPYSLASKMYDTGDIAQWMPDGNIEYMGRKDDQVKINGNRVELNEITHYLKTLATIENAETIFINDKIVSYFTGAKEVNDTIIRNFLISKLPGYMIPHFFYFIKEIPLTQNGKSDYNFLKSYHLNIIDKPAKEEIYSNEFHVNDEILNIWSEVLEVSPESIDVSKNFFENGGDSLALLNLIGRLNNIGHSVTYDQFMDHPYIQIIGEKELPETPDLHNEILNIWGEVLEVSPESIDVSKNFFENGGDSLALLNLIGRLNNIGHSVTYDQFMDHPFVDNYKGSSEEMNQEVSGIYDKSFLLAPIQKWFFNNAPENVNFLMYSSFILEENYQVDKVLNALRKIVTKHSSFRLRFSKKIYWTQHYEKSSAADDLYIFKQYLDDNVNYSEQFCLKEADRMIDVSDGPILYCSIFASEGKSIIFFACPHLVIDAVSWNVFINDFTHYYHFSDAPLRNFQSYKDWLDNVNSYVLNHIDNNEIEYWIEQVNDQNEYAFEPTENRKATITIPLVQKSKNLEDIIVAGIISSIGKLLNFSSIVIEKEGHGRKTLNDFNCDTIIGWFTTKFPVKYQISNSLHQTLKNVFSTNDNVPYSGFFFDKYKNVLSDEVKQLLNFDPKITFNFLGSISKSGKNSFPLLDDRVSLGSYINQKHIDEVWEKLGVLLDITCGYTKNEAFININSMKKLGLSYENWILFKDEVQTNIQTLLTEENQNDNEQNILISPFQEGLIAHAMFSSDHSNDYIVQYEFKIDDIDTKRVSESCRKLIDKFDILKTAYYYDIEQGKFACKLLSGEDAFVFNTYNNVEDIRSTLNEIKKLKLSDNTSLIKFSIIELEGKSKIFAITAHHLIMDGQSMMNLIKELFDYYVNNNGIPNTHTSYNEYVKHVLKQDKTKATKYWKELLSGLTVHNEVQPAPYENTSYKEEVSLFEISGEIQNIIKQNKTTLSSTTNFITGFVLSELLNQSKFTWGNIVNYRSPEIENVDGIIGPCINTIPVFFDFKKQYENIFESIRALQKQILESRNFSYVSLNEITSLHNQTKLFDVLFTFQNYKKGEIGEANLKIEMINEDVITSHFPITVTVSQLEEEKFIIRMKYNNSFYNKFFINNCIDNIIQCLSTLELNITTQNSIITGKTYNADYQHDSLVHRFVEESKKSSDKIAIRYDDESFTYKDLNEESNAIFCKIQEQSVTGAVFIFIKNPRIIPSVILGILKSRMYFVNIDESFSANNIDRIYNQLVPELLITDDINNERLISIRDKVKIMQVNNDILRVSCDINESGYSQNDLVTINYTSGSTGEPKLVKINNRNHLNRLDWLIKNYPATQEDHHYILKSSFSFAPSLREFFEPLTQGAVLHILKPQILNNVDEFCEFIQLNKISRLFLTPSYVSLLIENNKLKFLTCVQVLELSGEPYSIDLVNILKKEIPHIKILNRYGCTEAASVVYYDFDEVLQEKKNEVPAGHPIYNTEVMIYDNDKILPIGTPGFIYIKSESLSSGYVEEKFNENKFISIDGKLFLNTEDIGYIGDDKNLYYISRNSRMVKIRGYRVELDEIERSVAMHANIAQSYAMVEKNDFGNSVSLFYSTLNKQPIEANELYNFLLQKLPQYSVPSKYTYLDKIPLTRNNKVDAMQISLISKNKNKNLKADDIIFNTEFEEQLSQLIKETLKSKEEIDPNQDFMSLGMDSILAMHFLHKLYSVLNIKADPILLYKNNTIRSFTNALDRKDLITEYTVLNPGMETLFVVVTPAGDGRIDFDYLENLAKDFSIMIFHPIRLEKEGNTIEYIAESYKRNIHLFLNENPDYKRCIIAGWSLGATVAYEMSRLMNFDDILLIDPGFYNKEYDAGISRNVLLEHAEKLDKSSVFTNKYVNTMYLANQLIVNYKPVKVNQKIVLIKPEIVNDFERNYNYEYNQLDLIGNKDVEVVKIAGNHMTMLSDLSHLLEIFNQYITMNEKA